MSDYLNWAAFATRVTLPSPPLGVRFEVIHEPWFGIIGRTSMVVRDRDQGGRTVITSDLGLPHYSDPNAAALYIRQSMLHMLGHELDEQFHVDGIRIFDPHATARFSL